MRRPRSVTGQGVVLIVIAVLALLNLARGLVGEFLLADPGQTLVPAGVGILSLIAAVRVFRGRRWSQILAIGVGAASLLGGVMLSLPMIVEWGMPGSFAVLLLPFAFVAFLIGAYVLYAALVNRPYFHQ
jgi:hypothetical protein